MSWSPPLPVAEFSPSADPTTQGVLLDATNIIPTDRGWRSAYALADTGMDTLTATCVSSVLATKMDGTTFLIAATGSELFVRSGNTWGSVNPAGVTYNGNADQRWTWAMMGDNLLAANISDTIIVSAAGATFADVTSAPQAAIIESVYGFIMAANTLDGTYGTSPDRWWCSALFDHTSWTPNVTTQATTGRLVDTPGPITGLRRLGSNMVAYKKDSMYLGEYVEPPTVWKWTLISSNVGCASHNAVVNVGKAQFFVGPDNVYVYDGAQVLPIGEPIRQWFFDSRLYGSYATRIQSSHDKGRALIYWYYPVVGGTGALTAAIVYNYRTGKWGVADYAVECAVDYVAAGITYDGLGTYYSTYDAGIDRTYDSPLWIPGNIVPAVFHTSHVMHTLDGASGSSSFTSWHLGDDQAFSLLRRARIRWIDDPATATLTLYTINEHGASPTLSGTASQTNNKFDILRSARWHKLKFDMTGTHEFASLLIELQPQGDW